MHFGNLSSKSGVLFRYRHQIAIVLVSAGVGARLLWLDLQPVRKLAVGEALYVAKAFAETGTIADAFHAGQGPTAHLPPLPAIISGLVYRLFGFQTPFAEGVLTAWTLLLVFGAFWLLFRSFEELDSPIGARFAGLACLCLLPLNFDSETVMFRVWDGGLSVALAALYLLILLRLDRQENPGIPALIGVALLAAVLVLNSPPLGLAAYACAGLFMLRKVPPRRWTGMAAIAALCALLVLGPWTLRNLVVMGKPIVFRDNFGLEIAQANYDGALTNPEPDQGFRNRQLEIHPAWTRKAYEAMRAAGGEAAYSEKLGIETVAWIRSHPRDFALLTWRHLVEFFFPPRWYFTAASTATSFKLVCDWLFSLLGLAGVVYALARLDNRYQYAVLMTLVPVLPYLVVQPTLRYHYIVFGMLVYLSMDFVFRLYSRSYSLRGLAQLGSHLEGNPPVN